MSDEQYATDCPEMNLADFVNDGYLQEVNRRFFHPLGLALAVNVATSGGQEVIVGGLRLLDSRDDPTGVHFEHSLSAAKTATVNATWEARRAERERRLGYMVQPPVEFEWVEDGFAWSRCAICNVPIYWSEDWNHQGGTPDRPHQATPRDPRDAT